MKKILIWTAIAIASLAVILVVGFNIMISQTKKHSPEATVEYVRGDNTLSVFYNRPSKKGREIFGGLVPYDIVWRTGANEATTFTTSNDLSIAGQLLPAGKYTLWTIPGREEWDVIFNKKMYRWGVSTKSEASRDPEADALKVSVPVQTLPETIEQFTISFEEANGELFMVLAWDKTRVAVPVDWRR